MSIDTINLEPEESGLDGQDLDTLIALWLKHMSTRVDAKVTLPGYRTAVRFFRRWWSEVGPSYGWVFTRRAAEAYELDLRSVVSRWKNGERRGTKLSYRTRQQAVNRLKSMFLWAYATERTGYNYGVWVPPADGAAPIRIAPTLDQLGRLMTAVKERARVTKRLDLGLRNQTIVALLLGAGLRRGEIINLDIEQIRLYDDGTGVAVVTGKRTKRNRTGQRQVALDLATCRYLVTYLNTLDRTEGPLFLSQRGKRLDPQSLNKLIREAITYAGLSGQIQNCHDLRRAFATHFARHNPGPVSGDFLRRQLGHANFEQTASYILLGSEDLRRHITGPLAEMG